MFDTPKTFRGYEKDRKLNFYFTKRSYYEKENNSPDAASIA
jgi:hypothetical protein